MIFQPQRKLHDFSRYRYAKKRGQRQHALDFVSSLWQWQRSIEPPRCIALAHKAHRHLRPQQKHEWIGVDARTLHLQRQVKPLCLHLLEKLHHAMRVEELLSYPWKTWKRDVVVQVKRPFNQVPQQWQRNHSDFCLRQSRTQRTQRGNCTEKIADT